MWQFEQLVAFTFSHCYNILVNMSSVYQLVYGNVNFLYLFFQLYNSYKLIYNLSIRPSMATPSSRPELRIKCKISNVVQNPEESYNQGKGIHTCNIHIYMYTVVVVQSGSPNGGQLTLGVVVIRPGLTPLGTLFWVLYLIQFAIIGIPLKTVTLNFVNFNNKLEVQGALSPVHY